jgi:hypothetical protein
MENSTNAFRKTCTDNKDVCTVVGNIPKTKVHFMSLLYQQNKTPPLPEAACAWGMRTTKLPGSNLIQTPFLVRKIKQDLSPVANWNFNHTFS